MKVALAWIQAFNAMDIKTITAQYSDNLQHYILPASIGHPMRGKTEWTEWYTSVMPMFKKFEAEIIESTEVPGKIILHARSTGESTTDAPYANEYMLTLHFDGPAEDPKICIVKEFVDSDVGKRFFAAERERQAKKAADGLKAS